MKKLQNMAAGIAVATMISTGSTVAQEPADLRFGTVGVGSAWYVYGAGFAELALPKLPEGSRIDVLPVAGAIGNLKLMQTGEMELGLSHVITAAYACNGTEMYDEPLDKVRGMIGGLDNFYLSTFVTARSGVDSWEDIVAGKNGFRLLTAPAGGIGELGVRQVLRLMGSSYDDIASKGGSIQPRPRADTTAAISDGQAQGWAHVVTKGQPTAVELTTSYEMKVLPLPEDVIDGMVENFGWARGSLPAGTFNGQPDAVATVNAPTNIMVSADVPEDVVYEITKAILENIDRLTSIHAGLGDLTLERAADPRLVGNCPWHPGAERYFKEVGLL